MGAPSTTSHRVAKGHGFGERLREELRAYAIVVAYLYVCFGALILYKTALLRVEGLAYAPWGLALVKALILGKFLLIGKSVGVGTVAAARNVLNRIALKSVLYLVLLVVMSAAEELITGWIHGRSAAQTLAEIGSRSAFELLATCVVLLLVLIPFIAFTEISRALGPGVLKRTLLGTPDRGSPPR